MFYDAPGIAQGSSAPSAGDYADLKAASQQGVLYCNTRPGANRDVKIRKKTGPKSQSKHTRCPGCGGMVIAPCIACNPQAAYDPRLNTESSD